MLRRLISQSLSLFQDLRTKLRKPISTSPVKFNNTKVIKTKPVNSRLNSSKVDRVTWFGSFTKLFSSFYYGVELFSLLVGILTLIISLGVYLHPDFIVVAILPVLTTFLANYQISMLLGFLGFEWFPESPQTWSDFFFGLTYSSFSWTTWFITKTVNFPLQIFDHVMSTLVWWNTFVVNFILTGFGVAGLWAFLKVASIIKFIYASTIAAMTAGQLSGIIPGILTFSMQTLILAFVDPIAALINSPTLGGIITFMLPDPLGIWNAFITANLIPWTLFRELVINTHVEGFITLLTASGITVWNLLIQDITWLGLNTVLHVSSNPTDIVTYIFGPLDQRLGQIISSVQSLRSLWR